ncbi:MAG: UTRA domain-containing protein [Pseudonocardiaceae bacterium]
MGVGAAVPDQPADGAPRGGCAHGRGFGDYGAGPGSLCPPTASRAVGGHRRELSSASQRGPPGLQRAGGPPATVVPDGDQPVSLCDSYYPADMAVGTAIAERRLVQGGALAVIEDPAGPIRRMAARSVDELTSRMPTRAEIDQLRLSLGVPVVRVLRTIYDTQGAPLEVQDSVAAADRHEFRYEVDMR